MDLRRAMFVVALLGLTACPKKDDDETAASTAAPPTTVTPVPTPAPTPTPTTDLRPEGPGVGTPKPGIEARVKAELDNRVDGITGTPVAVAGALASLQAPSTWQTTKSDFTVVAPADRKAQIAAGVSPPGGAAARLPAAATALGLTSCEWNPPETVTVGKSKLAATAADGVCTRGTASVRAAYVAPNAENLLVMGAWDPDGDSASVFGAMRSIAKAGGGVGGDPTGIGACCAALRQNANSAPPEQKGALLAAAGICEAVKNSPQGRQALAQVRAVLAGANVPSSCR